MSHSQLSEENIDYVLDEFDAGVELNLILNELHVAGYVGVTITAIQECLQLYGRIASLNQPIVAARGQSAQSAAPANAFQQNPNNPDDSRTHDPLTPPEALEVPALRWNSPVEQASSFSWDAEADEFAKGAHSRGLTVPEIAASLCRNGYSASTAQVVASLNGQGVSNVRWW